MYYLYAENSKWNGASCLDQFFTIYIIFYDVYCLVKEFSLDSVFSILDNIFTL